MAPYAVRRHDARHRVASLPRDQRCWHSFTSSKLKQYCVSHRFREINAVGTRLRRRHRSRLHSRIASERSTLLAPKVNSKPSSLVPSHRFREINAVGTSSCQATTTRRAFRRIASERSTLLAPENLHRDYRSRLHTVASLPRDQRCWHWVSVMHEGIVNVKSRIASERSTLLALMHKASAYSSCCVASLPRDQRCWHIIRFCQQKTFTSRIASERSTLLAPYAVRRHDARHRVASLPRDQRCWHSFTSSKLKQYCVSHRFREINAVGTRLRRRHRSRLHSRIASERSTLLARFGWPRERWPRGGRIASERSTLLAPTRDNPIGSKRLCRIASERSTLLALFKTVVDAHKNLRRIASERSTLLAPKVNSKPSSLVPSHRFREINAVGTSSCQATTTRRAFRRIASERSTLLAPENLHRDYRSRLHTVASLPRDQRCWHWVSVMHEGIVNVKSRIASERSTLLALMHKASAYSSCCVASLPRDQRCWHIIRFCQQKTFTSRIASERSTLLAPTGFRPYEGKGLSHRFREINAVGTLPRIEQRLQQGRIASERSTLLARPVDFIRTPLI